MEISLILAMATSFLKFLHWPFMYAEVPRLGCFNVHISSPYRSASSRVCTNQPTYSTFHILLFSRSAIFSLSVLSFSQFLAYLQMLKAHIEGLPTSETGNCLKQ